MKAEKHEMHTTWFFINHDELKFEAFMIEEGNAYDGYKIFNSALQSHVKAELQQLYEWMISDKREPAKTHFTEGEVRNIAKEIEFQEAKRVKAEIERLIGEFTDDKILDLLHKQTGVYVQLENIKIIFKYWEWLRTELLNKLNEEK